MASACKYTTRAVLGQYSRPDFTVMPTGIVSPAGKAGIWTVKVNLIQKVRMI